MGSMYGTSSDNVYIVGWHELNRGMMFRFGGSKWHPVRITAEEGGPISGAIGLQAIRGSAPNYIWIVGPEYFSDASTSTISDSSLIIHFDGSTWSKVNIPN
jgi:hypothetical protein